MTKLECQYMDECAFQLTSSRRGWQVLEDFLDSIQIFQLTSSRRGWPFYFHVLSPVLHISTHILTKRMTNVVIARGESLLYFNSHPHEEDDLSFSYSLFRLSTISTHILTKRMTLLFKAFAQSLQYFNSHPHEEDDVRPQDPFLISLNISTHILTKRMTCTSTTGKCVYNYFNSHPHEEDDDMQPGDIIEYTISTHILTKRMTKRCRLSYNHLYISTHILTKRMTATYCPECRKIRHFNSHPHEEDDFQ